MVREDDHGLLAELAAGDVLLHEKDDVPVVGVELLEYLCEPQTEGRRRMARICSRRWPPMRCEPQGRQGDVKWRGRRRMATVGRTVEREGCYQGSRGGAPDGGLPSFCFICCHKVPGPLRRRRRPTLRRHLSGPCCPAIVPLRGPAALRTAPPPSILHSGVVRAPSTAGVSMAQSS